MYFLTPINTLSIFILKLFCLSNMHWILADDDHKHSHSFPCSTQVVSRHPCPVQGYFRGLRPWKASPRTYSLYAFSNFVCGVHLEVFPLELVEEGVQCYLYTSRKIELFIRFHFMTPATPFKNLFSAAWSLEWMYFNFNLCKFLYARGKHLRVYLLLKYAD